MLLLRVVAQLIDRILPLPFLLPNMYCEASIPSFFSRTALIRALCVRAASQ
jgi:hypothetical protein